MFFLPKASFPGPSRDSEGQTNEPNHQPGENQLVYDILSGLLPRKDEQFHQVLNSILEVAGAGRKKGASRVGLPLHSLQKGCWI
jgi:hypothetical protein